jgi:hypothetical protein
VGVGEIPEQVPSGVRCCICGRFHSAIDDLVEAFMWTHCIKHDGETLIQPTLNTCLALEMCTPMS